MNLWTLLPTFCAVYLDCCNDTRPQNQAQCRLKKASGMLNILEKFWIICLILLFVIWSDAVAPQVMSCVWMQVDWNRSSLFCQIWSHQQAQCFHWVTAVSQLQWHCSMTTLETPSTNCCNYWINYYLITLKSPLMLLQQLLDRMLRWTVLLIASTNLQSFKTQLVLLFRGVLRCISYDTFRNILCRLLQSFKTQLVLLVKDSLRIDASPVISTSACCLACVHVSALKTKGPNPNNGILTVFYKVTYIWSLAS